MPREVKVDVPLKPPSETKNLILYINGLLGRWLNKLNLSVNRKTILDNLTLVAT